MITPLDLLLFEWRQWRARRACRKFGHPATAGEYPPLCTRCGAWVK